MYLREVSGSKFLSVTSSNVILYNDVKISVITKSEFIRFWKSTLQLYNTQSVFWTKIRLVCVCSNSSKMFNSSVTLLSTLFKELV